jgi:hypothetical protein
MNHTLFALLTELIPKLITFRIAQRQALFGTIRSFYRDYCGIESVLERVAREKGGERECERKVVEPNEATLKMRTAANESFALH